MHLDGVSVVGDRHRGPCRGWGRAARLAYSSEVSPTAAASASGETSTGGRSASGHCGQCGPTKSDRYRQETFANIRHVLSVRVGPSVPLR
jgi:hypothetical protein